MVLGCANHRPADAVGRAGYDPGARVGSHPLRPHGGLPVRLFPGAAHLSNFGGFASPERDLVFDVNDFDETHPGPFEWDLKRLAASFEVAARGRGFDATLRTALVSATARGYREAIREFATMRNLDIWYSKLDAAMLVDRWSLLRA